MNFQIGDRVRIRPGITNIGGFYVTEKVLSCPATIVFAKDSNPWPYGIEFDKSVGAHNCDGYAAREHGLWVTEDDIELYETSVSSIVEKELLEVLSNG